MRSRPDADVCLGLVFPVSSVFPNEVRLEREYDRLLGCVDGEVRGLSVFVVPEKPKDTRASGTIR